jgi:hypothetical protein
MKHVLEVVLSVPPNSVIHLALAHEGYAHPLDFLTEKDETLDSLEYLDQCGTPTKIPGDGSWLLKIFKLFVAYQNDQGIPYEENYWTNITSAQFNIFRSSKGYDTSPILINLMPKTIVRPSSVDVFVTRSCLHELHGGDLGINASTSVHKDTPEPSSLSLESYNVTSQATETEPSFDTVYDPSQDRQVIMPFTSVLPLQVPDLAPKASKTFILAPNTRLKPRNLVSKSSTHFKKSFDSSIVDNKTAASKEPKAPIKQHQMASLINDIDLPAHLDAPETPKSQHSKPLLTTCPCLQDLCWGRQSENVFSNFDFLDATSAPEVSPVHSNAPETCQIIPDIYQSALSDYTSQYMVQDDGETALHATAMELDTLLYSNYGMYALDEETITLEPFFASTDDAGINERIDPLTYEQDSMLVPLAFEQDASLAHALVDTLANQLCKEARHISMSTLIWHIKHSPKRFSHAIMINWKHILTGNKDHWMPMSYNKSTSQVGSSYGEFIENKVYHLQTTLPSTIAMMGFENPFNLSTKAKLRPPPSPNIAVPATSVLFDVTKTLQLPLHNATSFSANGKKETSILGILDHLHGAFLAHWIPIGPKTHYNKPVHVNRCIHSHQMHCTDSVKHVPISLIKIGLGTLPTMAKAWRCFSIKARAVLDVPWEPPDSVVMTFESYRSSFDFVPLIIPCTQAAPYYWNPISSKLRSDGEGPYASQHAPQKRPFWYLRAPLYGERMSSNALVNLPSHSNCLGSSFLNPWGEKQAYTAHVGWENG